MLNTPMVYLFEKEVETQYIPLQFKYMHEV